MRNGSGGKPRTTAGPVREARPVVDDAEHDVPALMANTSPPKRVHKRIKRRS